MHMEPSLPLIGSTEDLDTCLKALSESDAVMVIEDGKPLGVLTRHDLLGVHI
jgi:cystathionine beta-synthase